jgi:hypothetical protein
MILAQQLGGVEVAESLCNVAHWYIACVLDQEYNLKTDFVMKTDDDTFLRVDAVLSTIFESKHNSNDTYPPWAHGPGYIMSQDIAHFVVEGHQKNLLKVCTLPSSPCDAADFLHIYGV